MWQSDEIPAFYIGRYAGVCAALNDDISKSVVIVDFNYSSTQQSTQLLNLKITFIFAAIP